MKLNSKILFDVRPTKDDTALVSRNKNKRFAAKHKAKMKIKYWTVCVGHVQGTVIITHTGNPFTNLREAKSAKKQLHSSNAAVVNADDEGMPTKEVVG